MKKPTLIYRDVTADPEAAEQANRSPELRADLLALGFTPLGLVEARAPEPVPELMPAAVSPDLRKILEVAANGEVDEVLSSPDQRALAAVESAFERPVVSLRTWFEDGSVVETTMKPERPPQFGNSLAGVFEKPAEKPNPLLALTFKLMEFGMGKTPLWPRVDCPQAGYHVELVETRQVRELWRRHQQRLADFQQSNAARARVHNSLALYMAFSCRTQEIIEHQGRWGGRLNSFWMAVFILAMPLVIWMTFQLRPVFKSFADSPAISFLALMPIFVMLAASISIMILMGLTKTYLVPRLPGPKLRPLTELLDEVQARLTTEAPPRRQASGQAEIPAVGTTGSAQLPASIARFNRRKPLIDRIFAGLFTGALLGGYNSWALTSLDGLRVAQKLGGGLLIGALTALWMLSGLNFKDRLLLGAFGGLLTVVIMSFIPIEGPARYIISGFVGVLLWVIGGLILQPPAKSE